VPLDDRLVPNLDVTNGDCLEDTVYTKNEVVSSEEQELGSLWLIRINSAG
jgi:hypothetical protein